MKVRGIVAAAMVVGFAGLLTPGASAQPAVDCTSRVVDLTDGHVLNQPAISAAIQNANRYGADVYVRAFQQTPGGSGDAFWSGSQGFAACANWRSADQVRPKSNVVMLAVGMDRQGGLFYGPAWNTTLNPRYGNITGDMVADFGRQDYNRGFIGALDAIAQAIDPAQQPVASDSPSSTSSVDGAVFLWLLGAFVGIVVLVTVVVGMAKLVAWRRQRREAYNKMIRAKEAAGEAITNFSTTEDRKREYAVTVGQLSDDLKRPFDDRIEAVLADASTIIADYNSKVDTMQGGGLTVVQMVNLGKEFGTIVTDLKGVNDRYDTLTVEVQDLSDKTSPEGLVARADAIDTALRDCDHRLTDHQSRFNVANLRAAYVALDSDAKAARNALPTQPRGDSHKELTRLESEVASLDKQIEAVVAVEHRFDGAQAELSQLVERMQDRLDGLTHIDTMSAQDALSGARSAALDFLDIPLDGRREPQDAVAELDEKLAAIKAAVPDQLVRDNKRLGAAPRSHGVSSSTSMPHTSSGGYGDGLVAGVVLGSAIDSGHGSSPAAPDPTPAWSPPPADPGSAGGGCGGGGGFSY